MTVIPRYEMNPAEDAIISSDEVAEGMWVLPEATYLRPGVEASEDEQLRGQRFCCVTRLRRESRQIVFIGEYIDGYEKTFRSDRQHNWIAKRDSLRRPAFRAGSGVGRRLSRGWTP